MLTEEEKRFLSYWEYNRSRKKRVIWQLAAGLPLGVIITGGILVSVFSDWYTRAMMQMNANSSEILVLLVALLLIVIFVVVFSARHRWEMNEQRYKELLQKKKSL